MRSIGWAGPARPTTSCGNWPFKRESQLGQDADVELEPLRLVNGHDAHAGGCGRLDALLLHIFDEIIGSHGGHGFVGVGQFDQLEQAIQVALVAGGRELLGPTAEHRSVAFVDKLLSSGAREPQCGIVVAMAGDTRRFSQRGTGNMESSGRIARMIGQGQKRHQQLDGRANR